MIEQARNEYVFAARNRVGIDAEQRQDARRGSLYALAVKIDVIHQRRFGRGEGLQHRYGNAGIAARRVNGHVDTVSQLNDALPRLAPLTETFFPQRRLCGGVFIDGLALVAGAARIDPGTEILGRQLRETQQQVAHIALRVDRDDRDVVQGRLFQ